MRIRPPTSRGGVKIRFTSFDIAIAAISPYLALYLRNAMILFDNQAMVISFCLVSFVSSLIAFSIFRIDGAIPRYLAVDDVLRLAQAVLLAELMTFIVLFTVTRLDGIPRSVPAIHALILGAGLLAARGFVRVIDRRRDAQKASHPFSTANLILIGLTDLAVLLIKLLDAHKPTRTRVVALLDPEPRWVGRSVGGVRVLGPPSHLGALIEEFATHGVKTRQVLLSGEAGLLLDREVSAIRAICESRGIGLQTIEEFLGSGRAEREPGEDAWETKPSIRPQNLVPVSGYFRWKGRIEALAALGLIVILSPLLALAAAAACLDVGAPILFWQQRDGLHGRDFQLYKVRTLRAAFDRHGRRTPEERRLSWVGGLLRKLRLDELPQLLNVLVGDMSLIGPRPLLTEDQPADPSVRLMVRPGITGWAQVNGGALLSPEEKEALDAWYIRHASLVLDLKIIGMTVRSFARGDRRSEKALALARRDREAEAHSGWRSPSQVLSPIQVETDASPFGSLGL